MSKKEIVRAIYEAVPKLTVKQAEGAYTAVVTAVRNSLTSTGHVRLHPLGSFFVRMRAARRAHDMIKKVPIDVPAKKAVVFRASADLKQEVKNNGIVHNAAKD